MSSQRLILLILLTFMAVACAPRVEPFGVSHVDRNAGPSDHPLAVDAARVGTYPGHTKSGAGYFYDEVLEYRVWLHPERGARPLAGGDDYFAAFARYEAALDFSKIHEGAEEPLALVFQKEHINEPAPGRFERVRTPRITEWKVEWLKTKRRGANSIRDFLAARGAGKR